MNNLNEENIKYRKKLSKHFLYPLFFPKNIVIVGASTKPNMGVSLYLDTYKKYGYGINSKLPNTK